MSLPHFYQLAQITRLDNGVFKSAHVYVNQGRLCVSLWLDDQEYATAIEALKECGWFCVDDEDNASTWRPTKHGTVSPLYLNKNTIYPPKKES